ncbi:hypothetical protein HMPREF1554_01797 [Porphyromonas gingivalis F0569]|nr:hypothetical protein HMPREF1554_01797 [Porphyromonas gingivalis F0569]
MSVISALYTFLFYFCGRSAAYIPMTFGRLPLMHRQTFGAADVNLRQFNLENHIQKESKQ